VPKRPFSIGASRWSVPGGVAPAGSTGPKINSEPATIEVICALNGQCKPSDKRVPLWLGAPSWQQILAAFVIGSVPAVLAQTTVEAETWDDAISKLECKDIRKNADGSFSVTGVIRVKAEVQHNPIINVHRYTAQLEEKKCAGREAMR
jgi:hypothetical protein